MMHVRFNEAWHGKMHKQSYKLSGAQYATPLHIDETPRDLFSSLSFMYPTRQTSNKDAINHVQDQAI